jgi:hypothetical protein
MWGDNGSVCVWVRAHEHNITITQHKASLYNAEDWM